MSIRRRAAAVGERRVIGRERFQPVFHWMHRQALAGLNYGVDDPAVNGEYALLGRLSARWTEEPVVFDVGGHRGEWSAAVLSRAPGADVHVFEPNSESRARIESKLGDRARVHALALGEREGEAALSAPRGVPQMGSLHARSLERFDLTDVEEIESVRVTTVDQFCASQEIDRIALLKLDVEGNELAAVKGASAMLGEGRIDAVQFEFGGTDIDSGVFMRDMLDAVTGYQVSRILRDGLDPVEDYDERTEIFALSNFLALRMP